MEAGGEAALVDRGEAFVRDVREDHEWQAGRIACAIHLPMEQVLEPPQELPEDGDTVSVCRSGNRARRVTRRLSREGNRARNREARHARLARGQVADGAGGRRGGAKPGRHAQLVPPWKARIR